MECSSPMCKFCKHYIKKFPPGRPYTCDAFPDGIPDKIFFEAGDHRQPLHGDNGIVFEKREDLTADEEDYFNNTYSVL